MGYLFISLDHVEDFGHSVKRHNSVTSTTKRGGDGDVKKQRILYLLMLSWYTFKWECYNLGLLNVIPKATTKRIAVEYTQKKIKKRKFKHFTTKTD